MDGWTHGRMDGRTDCVYAPHLCGFYVSGSLIILTKDQAMFLKYLPISGIRFLWHNRNSFPKDKMPPFLLRINLINCWFVKEIKSQYLVLAEDCPSVRFVVGGCAFPVAGAKVGTVYLHMSHLLRHYQFSRKDWNLTYFLPLLLWHSLTFPDLTIMFLTSAQWSLQ